MYGDFLVKKAGKEHVEFVANKKGLINTIKKAYFAMDTSATLQWLTRVTGRAC